MFPHCAAVKRATSSPVLCTLRLPYRTQQTGPASRAQAATGYICSPLRRMLTVIRHYHCSSGMHYYCRCLFICVYNTITHTGAHSSSSFAIAPAPARLFAGCLFWRATTAPSIKREFMLGNGGSDLRKMRHHSQLLPPSSLVNIIQFARPPPRVLLPTSLLEKQQQHARSSRTSIRNKHRCSSTQ